MHSKSAGNQMKIRINYILIILTLITFILFLFLDRSETYLATSGLEIYLLLAVTLLSLFINLHFKNDLLDILNIVFVVFFICRIPFLFFGTVHSDVITRNVNVDNISWSILVLIYQYFSLVVCIICLNPKIIRQKINPPSELTFKKIIKFSIFIVIINLINTFCFWEYGVIKLPNVLAILSVIFNTPKILPILFLSIFLVEKNVLKKYKLTIFILFASFIVERTYIGSKSGVLSVILALLLAMIVVRGPYFTIKLKNIILVFIGSIMFFTTYFLGGLFRAYQRGENITFNDIYEMFNTRMISIYYDMVPSISHRMGYLDFFIEKLLNHHYKTAVNFEYYLMSITDKLTPQFDVFNVPFLSRTLYYLYDVPSKGGTNSEQITLFAESHLLLGFFSFIMFFLIIFLLKYVIQKIRFNYGFAYGVFYLYVIWAFYDWTVGFGLDMWIVLSIIYNGLFTFFIIWFIKPKQIRPEKQIMRGASVISDRARI